MSCWDCEVFKDKGHEKRFFANISFPLWWKSSSNLLLVDDNLVMVVDDLVGLTFN